MTDRFVNFDEFEASEAARRGEGVTFVLGGEKFSVVPALPVGLWVDVLESRGTTRWQVGLLRAAIVDTELPALEQLLRDKTRIVDADMLDRIAAWLLEVYTGRPFEQPSDSSGGQSGDGGPSTQNAGSQASAT